MARKVLHVAEVGTVPFAPFPCIRSPVLFVVLFLPAFSSPFLHFESIS